jgi:hypothetical protein
VAQASVIQGFFPHGLPSAESWMRAGLLTRSAAQPFHAPVQRATGRASVQLPPRLANFPSVGGQPLAAPVRQLMEEVFRTSFRDVRVHVGPHAAMVGALAFTHGSAIHFAPGHYDPSSVRGRHVLAHELAHVVQQRAVRVRNPFGSGIALVHEPSLETDAERMAIRAAARPLPIQPKQAYRHHHGARIVQRSQAAPEKQASPELIAEMKKYHYRYVSTQAELGHSPPNRNTLNRYYQARKRDEVPDDMPGVLAQHMAGNKTDSPFVSVTTDFNLAAQTSDNSVGGLASIVNTVPHIAIFKFPSPNAGGPFLFPCEDGLPASEGEVLVLLPPGRTLLDYLHKFADNIYQGRQWMF